MEFKEGEKLTIKNPRDIKEFKNQLTIESADKINWTWCSYWKGQLRYLLFGEFKSDQDIIDWVSK